MDKIKGLIIAISLFVTTPVLAHGDAQWISDGGFKDFLGNHCCGTNDCKKAEKHQVIKHPDGIEIVGHGILIYDKSKPEDGHHESIDEDWWYCIFLYDGVIFKKNQVRCIFHPPMLGS